MQSATIYCPRCGAGNDPQMPYCVQCGTVLSPNSSQAGSGTVVQNSSPIAPPPPPSTRYGTFPANPPTVPAYPFDPYAQPAPQLLQPQLLQKKRGINPLLIVGILIALVLVVGAVVFGVIRANTPTYPALASMYNGSVHNNPSNITSTFTLTNVVEDANGNISGNAHVGSPLAGSGTFQGSLNADNQSRAIRRFS